MEVVIVSLGSFVTVSLLAALLLLLLHLVLSSSFSSQKHRQEPPGPKPLPLLGNLLQLDMQKPFQVFQELSKKYGPVFTVYLGPKKVVVLAGYKTVKEALVNYAEEFGEREAPLTIKEAKLNHGIVWANGDSWKEMRRFALINLRDFGMGKKACEDKISEECRHLSEEFRKVKGEAFDTNQMIQYAVSNIICSMIYGSRFEYDDPQFTSMVDHTCRNLHLVECREMQLYNMFPSIGKWLFSSVKEELRNLLDIIAKQHLQLLKDQKKTLNPETCRGVMDAFLLRQQELEESRSTDSYYNDENLLMVIRNLFAAGTETTSTTLRWGLLFMAKYPEIQDQVQEELRRVVGDRQPMVEDKKNLPLTDAVIHETQRLAHIVPVSLPHRTSRDVVFQGHFIQKGTTVYPLLASVLCDDSQWEKPHRFYPAHFLDKDGKFLRREAFMPFSAGRRMCPGDGLARTELFLFFATLLQHFRFTPPPGCSEDQLDLNPHVSGILSPAPHQLCAVHRM
ncbi:cytochrome P450 2K1-like isoform X2 [Brachyistius frenatus]|uniref:cytochrome P450 2K1-like isoform X2 n=1 Tax=Brachyistius frenatus TaxID=100188 RepID=UPI0037E8EA5D